MPLTGLQIYKLLPQTNCKECGYATCLAFAMKLAAGQADLSDCPHIAEAAEAQLEAAMAPPIREIAIEGETHTVTVGDETVLFRHEKTFRHPPGLFVRIPDTLSDEEIERRVRAAMVYAVEYVGETLSLDGIAVDSVSQSAERFAEAVGLVRQTTGRPLVLLARERSIAEAGLQAADGTRPLVYAATGENWREMGALAVEADVPLVVQASHREADLAGLAEMTRQLSALGASDLVLDPGVRAPAEALAVQTQLRRAALENEVRPLGYPTIAFPGEGTANALEETTVAGQHVAKYGDVIVLDHFDPASAYALLVLRANIFTDPQKPIQVQPGAYPINEPDGDAPVMVTTNFSITYFSVANEVESSGHPGWLLVADAEGMSVLTAWAAGKFDAERIAKIVRSTEIGDRVSHRQLIIPGHVAILQQEVADELPDWEVLVGPREAVALPTYLEAWSADNGKER